MALRAATRRESNEMATSRLLELSFYPWQRSARRMSFFKCIPAPRCNMLDLCLWDLHCSSSGPEPGLEIFIQAKSTFERFKVWSTMTWKSMRWNGDETRIWEWSVHSVGRLPWKFYYCHCSLSMLSQWCVISLSLHAQLSSRCPTREIELSRTSQSHRQPVLMGVTDVLRDAPFMSSG